MGIRMLQWIGLNERAKLIVSGEQVTLYWETVHRRYPDGHTEDIPEHEVTGSSAWGKASGEEYEDPFGGPPMRLLRHHLPDGRVLDEKVQADPWSSGPCVFTALQDEKGQWVRASMWTQAEIDAQL